MGAVVVKDGKVILEAFRGEIGRGDHAEYIALERRGKGIAEVKGADLITTLEPCTTRSHDKRPCVSWIKARQIRKVWLATLDPNPSIRGAGEWALQEDGILIGRFPDDLAKKAIAQNESFFHHVKSVSRQRGNFATELSKIQRYVESEIRILNSAGFLSQRSRSLLKDLIHINERILTFESEDDMDWFELGALLFDCGEVALGGCAFRVTTIISPSNPMGWIGRGLAQIEIFRKQNDAKKILTGPLQKAGQYLERAFGLDPEPSQWHAQAWLKLAQAWRECGRETETRRCMQRHKKLRAV